MHRLKPLVQLRNYCSLQALSFQYRPFSAQPEYVYHQDNVQNQILVEGRAKSRAAVLNRPSVLNALNSSMVARLKRLYESWEANPDIGFVLLKGSGKAFCAGADVVSLYNLLKEGNDEECKLFFKTLYSLAYLQGTYLKPHVAILDGMTMGCGGGISFPGMFCLATDRTVFSQPEVQMGFHPDAGASYYLSRLPGYLGEYLALTGDKLNGVEMIACRLATHYCLNARLHLMQERLGILITDEPSIIETSLSHYGDLVHPDSGSVVYK